MSSDPGTAERLLPGCFPSFANLFSILSLTEHKTPPHAALISLPKPQPGTVLSAFCQSEPLFCGFFYALLFPTVIDRFERR
jgi:hypothetical protein